jgi:hypothetical protein
MTNQEIWQKARKVLLFYTFINGQKGANTILNLDDINSVDFENHSKVMQKI